MKTLQPARLAPPQKLCQGSDGRGAARSSWPGMIGWDAEGRFPPRPPGRPSAPQALANVGRGARLKACRSPAIPTGKAPCSMGPVFTAPRAPPCALVAAVGMRRHRST